MNGLVIQMKLLKIELSFILKISNTHVKIDYYSSSPSSLSSISQFRNKTEC